MTAQPMSVITPATPRDVSATAYPRRLDASFLEPVDRGAERDGEEERDENPRQDLPRDEDHLEERPRRQDDPEHDEDRPHREPDRPFGDHGSKHRARVGR